MDASQTPTPDERLSTHHGLVSVANQLPMGENHWPDRIAMPVDIRDALVADLIDARGELEQLRTQHAALLAAVRALPEPLLEDSVGDPVCYWCMNATTPEEPDHAPDCPWLALAAAVKGAEDE
jgi:hypothetical protein